MKIRTLLAALSLLAAGLVTAPADATPGASSAPSALKKIREGFTCGLVDHDEPSGLLVSVGAGHFTNRSGTITRPCGNNRTAWHPTLVDFNATVRWYAGTTLLKKSVRKVSNRYWPSRDFSFYAFGLRNVRGTDRFTYKGKPVKVTVTMTKRGYATKVITRWNFPPEEP